MLGKTPSLAHAGKAIGRAFGGFGQNIINTLLPPLCPITHEIVDAPGVLSAKAWAGLEFIGDQVCAACGLPFDYGDANETLCAPCEVKPPPLTKARAALVYNDVSRQLILALKYGGHTDGIMRMADWMISAGTPLLGENTILVPVPLHLRRRIKRKFNQSALLSRAIARRTGLRFCPHLLERIRNTPSQAGRNARARKTNVARAFAVPEKHKASIQGARILLIDDVRTTGSTLAACARPLLAAGAEYVNALTLARIVKPTDITK